MSSTSALASGRVAAEEQMSDTFTAYAFTTAKVDDLDVQTRVAQGSTPGKIQGPSKQSSTTVTRTVTIGGVERTVVEGGLHIPYSATLPLVGWEYVCTAVGDPLNSFRVGRRWRVVDVPLDDATARRLDVCEVPNG